MYPGTHGRERPDAIAQVMATSGEQTTYRQLDERSNQLAQLLRSRGFRRGDVMAVLMENTPRYLEVVWAAFRTGLLCTPVNHHLKPNEVGFIVADSGAKALVCSSAVVESARLALADLSVDLALVADGRADGFEAWDDVVATQPTSPVADEQGGSFMLYSSGTTGRPRGIVPYFEDRPPDAPAPFVALMTGLYGFTPDSVYLSPAPLYHAAPLGWVQGTQRIGGTAVIMERFDPEGFLAAIERYGVTHTQVVPTMLIRLLRLPTDVRDRYDISTLRSLIHAAAPCPVAIKEQAIEWLGPIVNEFYSSSEGLGFTAIGSEDWMTHKGSVGRPIFGAINILGPDGQEQPTGTAGTIWFEEGGHFRYHNDPAKTAEAIDARGRATVGDIGYVDDEGFLYLTDRSSNLIVCGGVNVYPQEAENLLAAHPEVGDVAVFGVPDPELGEVVKAVVQPIDPDAAGPELAERLIAHCREHLATIKCPRSVDFDAALPRLANGKLLKREVRSRYWDGDGSVVASQVGRATT